MDPCEVTDPLVRWDGTHVVVSIRRLEGHLARWLSSIRAVNGLCLGGRGDTVTLRADITWKGVRGRVRVEIGEMRLRHHHLGFRIRRVQALGGFRVPRRVIEVLLGRLRSEIVTVVRGQGIVVVDLRRWLPAELSLGVLAVQATDRALHVWLGPGSMGEILGGSRPALVASSEVGAPSATVPEL